MPQVSLYLDEQSMTSLRTKAKRENMSLSKYVSSILADARASAWPESFWSVYGALTDESFVRPQQPDAKLDAVPDFDE